MAVDTAGRFVPEKTAFYNDPVIRGYLYQLLMILLVAAGFYWLITNAIINLRAQGKTFGFDFLWNTAGFDVACGMMAAPARALVSRLGLRLEQLGPERGHHGQARAPVRFVLAANVEPLAEQWEDRGQGGPNTRQAFTPPNPKEFESP